MALDNHKVIAKNLFSVEKNFLIQLFRDEAYTVLINPTEQQILTLLYILFFIAHKEIPIFNEYKSRIHSQQFLKNIKYFQVDFIQLKDLPKEILLEHLSKFLPYWNFLVMPILFEKNPNFKNLEDNK